MTADKSQMIRITEWIRLGFDPFLEWIRLGFDPFLEWIRLGFDPLSG
jgi:hypothetical protein